MKHARCQQALLLICFVGISASNLVAQNPVVDWNAIASTTIVTNGSTAANVTHTAPGAITPGGSSLYFAFVHLAVYNAVIGGSPHRLRYARHGMNTAGFHPDLNKV